MKVTVLNGSPSGENSLTMVLSQKFIEGLNSVSDNDIEIIDISKKKIEHCLGCFACWREPPYSCVIKDDVGQILKKLVDSDLIIWSFPLYHYGIPSKMKVLLDRTLPTSLLLSSMRNGNYYGILNESTKHVIISSCGSIDESSFFSVDKMFKLLYGEENLEKIYILAWRSITLLEDNEPYINYLEGVKVAGQDYAQFGKILNSTKGLLNKPILDKESFLASVEKWLNE